jgi:two-component system, sensor histidine kinase and response regulator
MQIGLHKVFLLLFIFSAHLLFAQQGKVDSLKRLLPTSKDTVHIKLLIDIAWQYRNSNSDSAFNYAQQALKLAEKAQKPYLIALSMQYIGVVAQTRGRYAESLELYFKVLEIAEKYGYKERTAYVYQSIGRINDYQKDYDAAINYTERSLNIFQELNNELGMSYCYLTLGEIYTKQKNYQKGFDYYNRSLGIRQKIKNKEGIAVVYSLIGQNMILQKKYLEASNFLKKAKSIFTELDNARGMINVLNYLSDISIIEKKWVDVLYYTEESISLSQKTNITEYIPKAYQNKLVAHLAENDFENAFYTQASLTELKDSLINDEKLRKAQEVEAQYLTKERSREIILLTEQNKNQRNFIYLSVVIVFLFILAVITFYFNIRQKQKNNEKLLEKQKEIQEKNETLAQLNEEIILQNEEIKQQRDEQSRINVFKDRLFSIISHDLRNPIASLKGALTLFKMDFLSKDERLELADKLERDLQSSSYLLDNLLNWAKTQMQGIKVNPQSINLSQLIQENFILLKPQAEQKRISLTTSAKSEVSVFADLEMIKTVIRNLLHNAIKYTNEGGNISVNYFIINDLIIIAIKDTGKGMNAEEQKKLFGAEHFSTHGTANEKGSGLGLLLCKDFIERNGGTIWVESAENEGSTFSFTLPK